MLLLLSFCAAPARAQDSVRDLGAPGQYGKFLTPGQLDRWVFDGEDGETITAHVASKEFDPVLELARPGGKDDDKVLLEVDDPGSESRLSFRLPAKGRYAIRVHAFKYQGGGNYTLAVRRFRATPLAVGRPSVGTFDRAGKGYHYFPGERGQILIPELKGAPPRAWQMLDVKGRELKDWAGTVPVEDSGECCLVVAGPPGSRYDLLVRQARRRDLGEGQALAGSLQQGEADVVSFRGRPGDFRLLEVEKKGELQSRLVYATDVQGEQRLARPGDRPEVELLPAASRGGRLRFAAVLGREGTYQLHLLAGTSASYRLSVRDPSVPIAWGGEVAGSLPVGAAAFYSFRAAPGQLVQASLVSRQFVPVLRLYDLQGGLVDSGGDDTDGSEVRLTHMVVTEGVYRLQVSSLGDGGGGEFRLAVREAKPNELRVGARGRGAVQPGATDFWAFAGEEGKTVILSVRSAAFEPAVSIRSPEGVPLATDDRGAATGSLFALRLPNAGRYTVWVSSRRGAGEYSVRLIDGD
jgi:hypothetical protein